MKNAGLLNLVLAVALAIMIGWLLVVGRPILVPVIVSLIAVYVLTTATTALGRVRILSSVHPRILRIIVVILFTLVVVGMALVVVVTVRALIANAPTYEARLESMIGEFATRLDFETHPTWADIRRVTIEQIDVQGFLVSVLGSISGFGIMLLVVIVYAIFLMSERQIFAERIRNAFPDGDRAQRTMEAIGDINMQVGNYLAVKTLINIILGVVSYVILFVMNVDFALFWAISIGLLNYIPYLGSWLGVTFPVLLSIVQFGDLQQSVILAALLVTVQIAIGNFLDPRLVGQQLNLSPFVILLSLAVWAMIWGLPGAILAVPMTAVMVIVCRNFEQTHFIAVLLSQRPEAESLVAAE